MIWFAVSNCNKQRVLLSLKIAQAFKFAFCQHEHSGSKWRCSAQSCQALYSGICYATTSLILFSLSWSLSLFFITIFILRNSELKVEIKWTDTDLSHSCTSVLKIVLHWCKLYVDRIALYHSPNDTPGLWLLLCWHNASMQGYF